MNFMEEKSQLWSVSESVSEMSSHIFSVVVVVVQKHPISWALNPSNLMTLLCFPFCFSLNLQWL